jgi:phosphatidate phosphatase PAH1
VEGVEDTGGRIYFRIPEDKRLGVGRHRIHFIVRGDLSSTDQIIQVIEENAQVVVSDVDGTLTESEAAQFGALFSGNPPATHPGAPEALWALANRGYLIFYITARPAWLASDTHDWLALRGFPPGLVHTTLGLTGTFGGAAVDFKSSEIINNVIDRFGGPPAFGIGNKESDAEVYRSANVEADHRLLFQLDGDAMGGRVFQDYRDLVDELGMAELACQ